MIEEGMERIARGMCDAYGAEVEFAYRRGYPATVNHQKEASLAAKIAAGVVGADNVHLDTDPVMGAEDFSFMLLKRPGAYLWLGQAGGPSGCMVHNPRYDFNDEVLPVGASVFATMVETRLGAVE